MEEIEIYVQLGGFSFCTRFKLSFENRMGATNNIPLSDFSDTQLLLGHGAVCGLFGMGTIASLLSTFAKIRELTSKEIRNYRRFSYVVVVHGGQSRCSCAYLRILLLACLK